MPKPLAAMMLGPVILFALGAAPALAANESDILARMLRGESAMQGKDLDRAVERAAAHPLGSRENPVRAAMPPGQRAYLARLRCSDGRAPAFQRRGNVGVGVFGNIVDLYDLRCAEAGPATAEVYMDMYHRGHEEDRAVPGFAIASSKGPPEPPPPAPLPPREPLQVGVPEPTA